MPDIIETHVMRHVAWRLVPFLGLGYYVNALDRSNIAIAALTMNKSLGFTAAEYGLGAGAFFWSYVLFQVPANMLLARLGARRWLSTIILAWALCSGATALVTGITSFVVVRFLLGVAEAGYFSGVIFFLTCWFPDRHRGRAMGVFYAFAAAAVSTGAPISGNILALHGWLGLQGWQWIFVLEAAPAVILAALAPFRAARPAGGRRAGCGRTNAPGCRPRWMRNDAAAWDGRSRRSRRCAAFRSC